MVHKFLDDMSGSKAGSNVDETDNVKRKSVLTEKAFWSKKVMLEEGKFMLQFNP